VEKRKIFLFNDSLLMLSMKRFTTIGVLLLLMLSVKGQVGHFIKLPNATLHYNISGKGNPILLLSGGPGNSANSLLEIANRLSKDFQCILFDQRGTGQSVTHPLDSTTINLDQAVKDINLLKEKLQLKKITIIGHSWGAMFAMYYATKYPETIEKLVLIGPGPLSLEGDITSDNRIARASIAQREFMKRANDSISKNLATQNTQRALLEMIWRLSFYDAYKADSLIQILSKSSRNREMGRLMMKDMSKKYNVREGVAKLRVPLLVISGRQDPVAVFPSFEIKELNNRATIYWINKSGHFPWLEQPEAFYSNLIKFLK
jgi:proline iminopeptidase